MSIVYIECHKVTWIKIVNINLVVIEKVIIIRRKIKIDQIKKTSFYFEL